MRRRVRGGLVEALKMVVLVTLFALVQNEVAEIRHQLHGNANGIALAQTRASRELDETRQLIRTAIDDSSVHFSQARRIFEESTEMLQDERRELARLIDDRTGAIESTLKDRLEQEKSAAADPVPKAATASVEAFPAAPSRDPAGMKRKMVFPTVQLRGDGTVGSGVLVYSEPQPGGDGGTAAVTFVLTAHHVVMEVLGGSAGKGIVDEIRVLGESEAFEAEVFTGEMVLQDRDHDLALLRLRTARRFASVAEFAPREAARAIDVFTPAYAVGCPLGNRPLPTAGEISSKSKVVGDQVFWMLNAPTFFGNSGGGIYLASTCQLIGISSMIYTYGKTTPTVVPHMGLFVPLEVLYDWLESEGHSFILRREPIPGPLRVRYGLAVEAAPATAEAAPGGSPEPSRNKRVRIPVDAVRGQ